MSRRVAPARTARVSEPVSWRDGVHVVGTPVWCDARRARDICFVSAADRIGRAGHGQLIATAATLAQLGASPGQLSSPYGRPFTLGTVRLELVPSGHALGAAALWIDAGGPRVLYAGAICNAPGVGLAEPLALRSCDALVVAAPYGAVGDRFPARATAVADWLAWADAARARGAIAVALVTSTSKAFDVAAATAAAGFTVGAHRSVVDVIGRLREAGALGGAAAVLAGVKRGAVGAQALVWPVRERRRLEVALGARAAAIALVSGAAIDPAALAAAGTAHGIAWSNAADRDELLALIAASAAPRIYLTGRRADAIAATLGPRARVLAPPRQMALFP
jgi:putative mRNA 3-end processing factor